MIKVKAQGAKLLTPLEKEVAELTVETEDQLALADQLLADIKRARRDWAEKMEPILRPLREAKQGADALNREIDRPLETLESKVKTAISLYRVNEMKRLEAQRREQEKEQQAALAKLQEVADREANARTKQMRDRLAQQREAIEAQLEQQEQAPAPAPVETLHSTRRVRRWRLKGDIPWSAVVKAAGMGKIPTEALTLDTTYLHGVPLEEIAKWPGFETYEEVVIIGRR